MNLITSNIDGISTEFPDNSKAFKSSINELTKLDKTGSLLKDYLIPILAEETLNKKREQRYNLTRQFFKELQSKFILNQGSCL